MKTQWGFKEVRTSGERGGVLVTAILVILVMLLMAIPFLFKLSANNRTTERAQRALAALNLAEAGIDRFLWEKNRASLPINPIIVNNADGSASAVITNLTTSDNKIVGDADIVATPPTTGEPPYIDLLSTGHVKFIADGTVDRTVSVRLQRFWRPIFDFAFVVNDHFYTQNNLLLNSYDSSEGAYGGTNLGNLGFLLADNNEAGSVIFDQSKSWEIYGQISAGYGTDPSTMSSVVEFPKQIDFDPEKNTVFYEYSDTGATVPQGDLRTVATAPFEFPPVDVKDLPPVEKYGTDFPSMTNWFTPGYMNNYVDVNNNGAADLSEYTRITTAPTAGDINSGYAKGSYTLNGGSANVAEGFSGVYKSFVLSGGAQLNITGEVVIYVTGYDGTPGQFYIDRGDINLIGDNARLTLILGNTTFRLQQNVNINAPGNVPGEPAECIILGTNQFSVPLDWSNPNLNRPLDDVGVMNFENNGIISAAIYAPGSAIRGSQGNTNLDIFGAAVSWSMDFKVNVNLHYDEALGQLQFLKGGIPDWRIINWKEVVGGN